MTREEIEELKGLAASMGLYDDKNPRKRAVILGKAIKALEQESVLDKIRAEIEQVKFIMNEEIINHNRKDLINFVNGLNQSLTIIDKYKEDKE